MSQLLNILTGNFFIFGYALPNIWSIAAVLVLLSVIRRSAWPALLAGIILYCVYFIPAVAAG
jgi:hypothetical protein